MIKAKYADGLHFDNTTIYALNPDIQVVTVTGSLYVVFTVDVTDGQHTAFIVNSNVRFGMIAYGCNNGMYGMCYGFPVGLKL